MSLSRPSTIDPVRAPTSGADAAREDCAPQPSMQNFQPVIDQVSEREWNDLLSQFADASLYQSWAYGAVSWGEKNLSHLRLRSAGQVVGMAQFRIVRVPLLSSGIAYLRWG